jgi:exonuclease III
VRIITWNCNGALRKKFIRLTGLYADIYVVQECEDPILTNDKDYQDWASNYLWIGDSKNKGIGIFAKENITLKPLDWSSFYKNHKVKHFLPCKINNDFDLIAVWTHKNNSPNFGYIGQFWKYLQVNKSKLGNSIIIGDFNSNSIWDEWDRWWNHTDVVNELKEIEIESVYHNFEKEDNGKESKPTFYLQRNLSKPYHIDYCFVSKKHLEKTTNFVIENFENWKHLSDHCPIIITLKQ